MNGPKGFSMYNLYLYLYCMAVTVFMLLTTLPVLAAGITMILFDRHFNTSFFNVAGRRDPILFQHLFWFFRHPEVYDSYFAWLWDVITGYGLACWNGNVLRLLLNGLEYSFYRLFRFYSLGPSHVFYRYGH